MHFDTITSHHSSSSSSLSSVAAVQRAMDMARILSTKVICPILKSSITTSLFQRRRRRFESWDEFWSTQTPTAATTTDAASPAVMISHARRLASALEELGPTYVKFGQALGSRPIIVPHSLAAALSALQDDMTPFDTDAAREIVLNDITNLIVDGNRTVGDDGPTWEDLRSLSVSLSSPLSTTVRGSMNVVDLGDWYDCCDVAMLRCAWATVVTVVPCGWSVGRCISARSCAIQNGLGVVRTYLSTSGVGR